jgi:hypothetical protein
LLPKHTKIKIYGSIILPVVSCGCESWSLVLRKEHRLKVFEKRVLRVIFGPTRDEIVGRCRSLHNENLNKLYSSSNIIRMTKTRWMRLAGYVARMESSENPEGISPLGSPRRRWEGNIEMDLREIGRSGMDLINLAQGKDQWPGLAMMMMKLRVP